MLKYLIKKMAYALLTLFGVVTVIFLLFNWLPDDPTEMMVDQNATQEVKDQIRKKYGFDKPLYKRYLYNLNDLSPISLHSNDAESYTYLSENKYNEVRLIEANSWTLVFKWPYLGESFIKTGKPVSEVINETLPNTVVLAISAITIAIILGVLFGIISASYKDTWIDRSIQIISTLGMSVPSFFSAIIFAWFFGFLLHKYTNLNMTGSLYAMDDFGEGISIQWKNLILPAVVLGIRPLAVVIQLMRNSLLEVYNQEYIRTAKAKGLSQRQIIKNHAIKNALNPVVTAVSGWFASMLAGAVFVEYIFGWNGLGKEIVDALNTKDLPVIMGAVLIIASLFIIINILVDLIYGWLDPKIRTA